MEAEGAGNFAQAAELFDQAWRQSRDDYERCIAAHYVARHQPSDSLACYWNQTAMDCAERVADSRTAEFLPSLHLNLGKSHEDLHDLTEAERRYMCAAEKLMCLPASAYREIVQDGIARGLQRVRTKMEESGAHREDIASQKNSL